MKFELRTPPVGARMGLKKNCFLGSCPGVISYHGYFLEGVYKIESDTKSEYEGF
jgi:hypothetical protein